MGLLIGVADVAGQLILQGGGIGGEGGRDRRLIAVLLLQPGEIDTIAVDACGVPVLNRRKVMPKARRLSLRRAAGCMPSGPDSSEYSPTKILPFKKVPVARMTARTE